ncbi:MAG: CmcJ/NvfI family oxidoreductase [Rhodospirillales bacterium]
MTQTPTFQATLRFLAPSERNPVYRASEGGADAQLELDGEFEDHIVDIENGRLASRPPTIDREAFALLEHTSDVGDFYDDRQINTVYTSEVERIVRDATGAARTHAFDHTRRAASRDARGQFGTREPSTVVHNDYTDKSGPQRVRDIMGEEAEDLLSRRFTIINVWRPIRHPAETSMLAICDAASTTPDQLLDVPRIAKDRIGELMLAYYDKNQRWVTYPAMTPAEALLLKTFDTETDGRARFAIHTAFDNPAPPPGALPRESIESRVFAFF